MPADDRSARTRPPSLDELRILQRTYLLHRSASLRLNDRRRRRRKAMFPAIRRTPLLSPSCPLPIWHRVVSPVHHDRLLSDLSPPYRQPAHISPPRSLDLAGIHKLLHHSIVLHLLDVMQRYLGLRRRLGIGKVNALSLSRNMQKDHMRSLMIRQVVRRSVNSNMRVSWRLNLCMGMVLTATMEVCLSLHRNARI
jgi:hypothetical protein